MLVSPFISTRVGLPALVIHSLTEPLAKAITSRSSIQFSFTPTCFVVQAKISDAASVQKTMFNLFMGVNVENSILMVNL